MSVTKPTTLTDTHLVILAHAAQRPDGCILPLPSILKAKGGATTSILRSLLRRGLITEQPASRDNEAWRRDEAWVPLTLVITPAGLSAIGLGSSGSEAGAAEGDVSGLPGGHPTPVTRTGTKVATLMTLIERDTGATLPELMAASGWQAHSVRGFLSGTIKKKLGRSIISDRSDDGARRYRIAG